MKIIHIRQKLYVFKYPLLRYINYTQLSVYKQYCEKLIFNPFVSVTPTQFERATGKRRRSIFEFIHLGVVQSRKTSTACVSACFTCTNNGRWCVRILPNTGFQNGSNWSRCCGGLSRNAFVEPAPRRAMPFLHREQCNGQLEVDEMKMQIGHEMLFQGSYIGRVQCHDPSSVTRLVLRRFPIMTMYRLREESKLK